MGKPQKYTRSIDKHLTGQKKVSQRHNRKENKHMTILKVTYGNPVASIKGICEHYQISDRTARMIVKELEQERGRYGDYTVLGDGALKRVNFLAFTDYWQFRKMLQDKNARKHVPVYSPQPTRQGSG